VIARNLIEMLRRQGKMEEALAAALDGVERSPGYAGFYLSTSEILEQQGQLAEALRWALGARAVAPMNPSPRFYECNLYLYLGDDASAESCLEEIRQDFPQIPEVALASEVVTLFSLRGQDQEAVDYLRNLLEEDQQNIGLRFALAFRYAVNWQSDEATKIYRELAPEYFANDEVVIDQSNFWLPMMISLILYSDGELDRANYLMDGALAAMRSMHRTRGNGYGIFDVFIHARRGDSQNAIAALRDAIDDGWRLGWWYLRHSFFDPMREEPEWNALVDEIEADVLRQRAWFEEHKDEPLF
jgi:tetratricopeptide (TPR) repeat protein